MTDVSLRQRAHQIYSEAVVLMGETHGDADPLPLALQHQEAQTPEMQALLREIASQKD